MLLATYYPNELDTLSLMEYVKYEQAFMFAYSMIKKTHAHPKVCAGTEFGGIYGTFELCVSGG